MADERLATREIDWLKTFPWLRLFRTFLVALDPFKLIVAAVGILTTALAWLIISLFFNNFFFVAKPKLTDFDPKSYQKDGVTDEEAIKKRNDDYSRRLNSWKLQYKLAGSTAIEEYETVDGVKHTIKGGKYRIMPWFEDRGPNPVSMLKNTVTGSPNERNETIGRFLQGQVFVLVEPLLKFLTPVSYLFDAQANTWTRLYLVVLLLVELAIWAFFGGIITRMAISTLAGKETGGLRGAIDFVRKHYISYVSSPVVPIAGLFAIVIGCMVFGLFHLIPGIGDILIDGLGWLIPLGAGFIMALIVLGLVGYPLMYTTLSAEGSDTFDALSRSYNYVYESPWSYLWYSIISILYGAVLVFFVVVVTSLTVYLANWGVSQTILTQTTNREPQYLYTYAPTSFGWRQLLLEGTPLETYNDVYVHKTAAEEYLKEYTWYNIAGAGMVSFWLTAVFMLMLGFSYSYFWTASSMIYLLMRKKVDETEIDEIHIDDADFEPQGAKVPPPSPTPAPEAVNSAPVVQMVDPPTLRAVPPSDIKPIDPPPTSSTDPKPSV
ncbi:hypothetical protein KIH39_10080 [Telmatocola sphagniphila]|uniref:Uncharacterized protein n=1 Tax=Telmatocola sphagniphila TaxID=1123043 RepID=A0A8E6BA69_9BACT|nr:hypothetical protein [Telmatocola sphagniphila]QVL34229.1 hypothetical protein KIH39_10080 [Telmatocola sphagniphila]